MALKPYFTAEDYSDPFPPAWIYGNQASMDAVNAWNARHLKTPPTDDFTSAPKTASEATRDAIVSALLQQGTTQGTDVKSAYLPGGSQGGVTDITDTAPPVTDITDTGKPVTDITDTPTTQKGQPQQQEAPAPDKAEQQAAEVNAAIAAQAQAAAAVMGAHATPEGNIAGTFSGFSHSPPGVVGVQGQPTTGTVAEGHDQFGPVAPGVTGPTGPLSGAHADTTSTHGSQTAAENALGHTTTASPTEQGWGKDNPAPVPHGVPLSIEDSPFSTFKGEPAVPFSPPTTPTTDPKGLPATDELGNPLGTPNIGQPAAQGKSLAAALAEKGQVQSPIGAPITQAEQHDMDKATLAQLAALQNQAMVDKAITDIAEKGIVDMGPPPNVQESVQQAAQQSQTTAPQSHAMSQTAAENEMGLVGTPTSPTAASLASQAAAMLGSPATTQGVPGLVGMNDDGSLSVTTGPQLGQQPGPTALSVAQGYMNSLAQPAPLGKQSAIEGLIAPVMAQEEDPDAPEQGPTVSQTAHGFMNDMDKADLAVALAQAVTALQNTNVDVANLTAQAINAQQKGDPLQTLADAYAEVTQAPTVTGPNTAAVPGMPADATPAGYTGYSVGLSPAAQAQADAAVSAALGGYASGITGDLGGSAAGTVGPSLGGYGDSTGGYGVTGQGFGTPGDAGISGGYGTIGAPGQGFSDGFGAGATGVTGVTGQDGSVAGASGAIGSAAAAAAAAAAAGDTGDGTQGGSEGGVGAGQGASEGGGLGGIGSF